MAQLVKEQSEHLGWIKDKVAMEMRPPLSEDQLCDAMGVKRNASCSV